MKLTKKDPGRPADLFESNATRKAITFHALRATGIT